MTISVRRPVGSDAPITHVHGGLLAPDRPALLSHALHQVDGSRARPRRGRRAYRFVLIVGLIAVFAAACVVPPPNPVLLGTHPRATTQSTEWGRRIQELAVFDGRVFAGYGDWGANTGPLYAVGWDIAGATWHEEASLDTESTWVHRVVGNRLVVPYIDPRANTADLAVRDLGSDVWTTLGIGSDGTAGTIHALDVATFDGTDLWVAGSERGTTDAAVWRSPSGLGGDWVEMLSFTPPAGRWARYSTLVTYNGKLYAGGYHYDGSGATPSEVLPAQAWDGSAWVPAPEFSDLAGVNRLGFRPMVYDGRVVRLQSWPVTYTPQNLLWFNGATLTEGPEQAYHVTVDAAGTLWWIDETLAVRRRPPGGATELVVQAPAGASALTVDGDTLYIGTAASELYVVPNV